MHPLVRILIVPPVVPAPEADVPAERAGVTYDVGPAADEVEWHSCLLCEREPGTHLLEAHNSRRIGRLCALPALNLDKALEHTVPE